MRDGIGWGRALAQLMLAGAVIACVTARARAEIRIVAIGDSNLDTPYLGAQEMYPARLEQALRARGHQVSVTNAARRGRTTQNVLDWLDLDVPTGTDIAIVGVGINDLLVYHLPKQTVGNNLATIVKRLRGRGIEVLLFGIGNPRDPECCWGKDLAERTGSLFDRNFQDGMQDDPKLHSESVRPSRSGQGVDLKATAWHLNAEGTARVVTRTLPLVETLIARVAERAGGR